MLADMCPNVYFDTSSTNSWIKYQPAMLEVRDVFRGSLDVLGSRTAPVRNGFVILSARLATRSLRFTSNLLFDLGVSSQDAALMFGSNLYISCRTDAERNRVFPALRT